MTFVKILAGPLLSMITSTGEEIKKVDSFKPCLWEEHCAFCVGCVKLKDRSLTMLFF